MKKYNDLSYVFSVLGFCEKKLKHLLCRKTFLLFPWFEIFDVIKFHPIAEIDTFFSQSSMTANIFCFIIELSAKIFL